jgi:hypothetical protein
VIKTEGEQELLQSIKEEERLSSLGFCCSDSQRPEKKDAVRESESCFLSCSFLVFTEREREREREREQRARRVSAKHRKKGRTEEEELEGVGRETT